MAHALHLRRASGQPRQLAGAAIFLAAEIDDVAPDRQRLGIGDAVHHFDREAMRIAQAHALAAARPVERFDLRRAFDLGEAIEVLLALGIKRHAEEFRLAELRHVQISGRIGAAHIKCILGARGTHHAEINEELFGLIEIGRLQPPESDIANFDDGHGFTPFYSSASLSSSPADLFRGSMDCRDKPGNDEQRGALQILIVK